MRCRAALLCATLDLPARAAVANIMQYNGYWGCGHCLQKGMICSYMLHACIYPVTMMVEVGYITVGYIPCIVASGTAHAGCLGHDLTRFLGFTTILYSLDTS